MQNIFPNSKHSHLCANEIASHVVANAAVGARGISAKPALSAAPDGSFSIKVVTEQGKGDVMMEFKKESAAFVHRVFKELKTRMTFLGINHG